MQQVFKATSTHLVLLDVISSMLALVFEKGRKSNSIRDKSFYFVVAFESINGQVSSSQTDSDT